MSKPRLYSRNAPRIVSLPGVSSEIGVCYHDQNLWEVNVRMLRGDSGPRLNFGDYLRRARRAAGLTQEELAEQAGLSARGISDIERGVRRVPRRDTLELLAQALQIPVDELHAWRNAARRPHVAPASPTVQDPQPARLVGREREFQLLRQALEQGMSGRGQVVLLAGEPGVGKTHLAESLAGYAEQQKGRVLWGRSHEMEGAPAYWPWIQIIRAAIEDFSPDVLRRDLNIGAGAMAQIVPELSDFVSPPLASRALSPEQAQFELFEAVTLFMRSTSLRAPLLLVLDDLHWADQSTLDLLTHFAGAIGSSQIVTLGLYRDTGLDLGPDFAESLARLNRGGHVQHLSLGGLSEPEAGQLIERVLEHPVREDIVSAIYGRTEGNPFFVSEMARLFLLHETTWPGDDADAVLMTVPPGVRGVLEQRYRGLSEECYQALTAASVIGREFSLRMLEAVTPDPREQLLISLDEALDARLIEHVTGSVGRYRFSHALVRQTLYGSLSSVERASLHRRAGVFFEQAHAGELGPHLSTLAHHFFEAIPSGDADKAIDFSIQAGDQAASQYAHTEAVNHYQRALEALDHGASFDGEMRCRVMLKLGDALNQAGQYRDAQETFRRVANISRDLQLPEYLGHAAVGAAGLGVIEHGERHHLQLLEDAVATLTDENSVLRSHVLARLSIVLQGPGTLERSWELSREAESIARSTGDKRVLLNALYARHRALWAPAFRLDRRSVSDQFQDLVDALGGGSISAPAYTYRVYDYLEIGDIAMVDWLIDEFEELAQQLRQPQRSYVANSFRTSRLFLDGRFDDAERLNDETHKSASTAVPALAAEGHLMFKFFLYRERGRQHELIEFIDKKNDWERNELFWRTLMFVLLTDTDSVATPDLTLDDLVARICHESSTDGNAEAAGVLLATSEKLERRPDIAARLYSMLSRYDGLNSVIPNATHFFCLGPISHALGLLATAKGCWDIAERHFRDAIEMNNRTGATPYLAHTRYALSRVLTARGEPGDDEQARQLAGQASETAEALGMSVLSRRSRALLDEQSSN